MANVKTTPSRRTGQFASRPSPSDELKAMKNAAKILKANPDKAKALFVRAGITTQAGKLTKAYGG